MYTTFVEWDVNYCYKWLKFLSSLCIFHLLILFVKVRKRPNVVLYIYLKQQFIYLKQQTKNENKDNLINDVNVYNMHYYMCIETTK